MCAIQVVLKADVCRDASFVSDRRTFQHFDTKATV